MMYDNNFDQESFLLGPSGPLPYLIGEYTKHHQAEDISKRQPYVRLWGDGTRLRDEEDLPHDEWSKAFPNICYECVSNAGFFESGDLFGCRAKGTT
jgi:hypothetical protein